MGLNTDLGDLKLGNGLLVASTTVVERILEVVYDEMGLGHLKPPIDRFHVDIEALCESIDSIATDISTFLDGEFPSCAAFGVTSH